MAAIIAVENRRGRLDCVPQKLMNRCSLRVLDVTFDPQVYAIALPQGSELRMPINLALLDAIRS
jgi:hypothetical protein